MSIKGYVMDIQPFSVNDGDGIRTTIFLAGCPLRCQWCSNPEGFEQRELMGWHERKCIGCGQCAKVCPEGIGVDLNQDRSRCTACGKCADVCPAGARSYMVRLMPADEVLDQIQRHRLFYQQSGGGITFSGGEATSQPEFLKYLADNIYDMGYSMAIETSGMFDWKKGAAEKGTAEKGAAEEGTAEGGTTDDGAIKESAIVSVLKKMDMIFMDLKFIDDDRHLKYTGVSNEKILKNIERLGTINDGGNSISPQIVIRIPVIGGVNDDEDNILRSAAFVHEKLPQARMELLPYHEFGKIKYQAMGMDYDRPDFCRPSKEKMDILRSIIKKEGVDIADFR